MVPDDVSKEELWEALDQALKIQCFYANLLNTYDGGTRFRIQSVENWVDRLRTIREKERTGL